MDNHYHIVVETIEGKLFRWLQDLTPGLQWIFASLWFFWSSRLFWLNIEELKTLMHAIKDIS